VYNGHHLAADAGGSAHVHPARDRLQDEGAAQTAGGDKEELARSLWADGSGVEVMADKRRQKADWDTALRKAQVMIHIKQGEEKRKQRQGKNG